MDFGIAKLMDAATPTAMGARAVTSGYSPPEQYGGGTDARSDLYALGATLYHLLTGQKPADSVQRAMRTAELPAPRALNPAVTAATEQATLKALELAIESRFQTAEEFRAALTSPRAATHPTAAVRTAVQRAPVQRAKAQSPGTRAARSTAVPGTAVPTAATPARPAQVPPGQRKRGRGLWLALAGGAGLAVIALGVGIGLLARNLPAGRAEPTPTAARATAGDLPAGTVAAAPGETAAATPTSLAPTGTPPATAAPTSPPSPTHEPTVVYQPIPLESIANGSVLEDYEAPPTGDVTLGGVPFRLTERLFKSQASSAPNDGYPTRARLSMDLRQAQRVHLLLTTGNGFNEFNGQVVAQVVAECGGSAVPVADLALGREVREWHVAGNVVSTAPRAQQVWSGPIKGFPDLLGHYDMLSLDLPEECRTGTLTALEVLDTSADTASSLDPALNLVGVTVEQLQ